MASSSNPDLHNSPKSQFKKTVCLEDWWLVKTEDDIHGVRLAVSGFICREKQAVQVFSSAPILKRHDAFTVETTDGICVIFKGFINKARSVENGFSSDVFYHFVFGFPLYWKEYEENFMGKESSSKDILESNLVKKLSPQSGIESVQPHVENSEKDFGLQGKTDDEGTRKSKRTKSLAVSSPKKFDNVIGGSEYNLLKSCTAPGGFEKESNSVHPTVENRTTLNVHMSYRKNKSKGNINISGITDEVLDDSQFDAGRAILSGCHLLNRSTDNPRKVELDKRNYMKTNFNKDNRAITRSMSNLKMKQKNAQKSNCVSSMASETVEFTSVDCEPQGRNNLNFEVFEFQEHTDEIKLSGFEDKDESPQLLRTPIQDKDLRKVKRTGNTEKPNVRVTRSMGKLAADDNQKDNVILEVDNLPSNAKASNVKTRRKLAYETPEQKKDKKHDSPECMSFTRSRSGRLLMPTLEFWRNQRAIYDSDRTITGFEGIHPEQQRKGSSATPQRKRKRPT